MTYFPFEFRFSVFGVTSDVATTRLRVALTLMKLTVLDPEFTTRRSPEPEGSKVNPVGFSPTCIWLTNTRESPELTPSARAAAPPVCTIW